MLRSFALALIALLYLNPAFARGPDLELMRETRFEFVAWSTDSSLILLKMDDPQAGTLYQVRDAKTGQVFRMGKTAATFPVNFAPNSKQELAFVRQLTNGRKVKRDGKGVKFDQKGVAEANNPRRDEIMLLTGQRGSKLLVMGIRGERATRYHSFDLLKADDGTIAEASQKALVWDDSGKNVIIIYNQKLQTPDFAFDGDFFEVLPFKSYKVPGAREE